MGISIFLSRMNDATTESAPRAVREEVAQLVRTLDGVRKDLTDALDPSDVLPPPRTAH